MAYDPLKPKATFESTAMQPDDLDPTLTRRGNSHYEPGFDELSMLSTLENPPIGDPQAQLSPQEAYDQMKFSAPLDAGEVAILESTPFLGPELSFVDDADHNEWIMNQSRGKTSAMDHALEDVMYGEDESGWGFSSLTHAISRAAKGVEHAALAPARLAAGLVKKFVPGRDAQKAALIKKTNARLTQGRANFLQMADVKNGIKNRPRSYYVAQAQQWSRSKLANAGLPTSFTTGEVAATILGNQEAMMGSWWNPFSWFQSKVNYVVADAQGQITEMDSGSFNNWLQQQQAGGAGQPQQVDQYGNPISPTDPSQAYAAAPTDPSQMAPMDPSQMAPTDPSMYAAPDGSQGAYGDLMGDEGHGGDRWERDIDLHQMIEKAVRGDGKAGAELMNIKKKAAAGDKAAAADMDAINSYQKETGMHLMGEDEDTSGAFSRFAGDVIPAKTRRKISDSKYRQLTMQVAQKATGNPTPPPSALVGAEKRVRANLARNGVKVVDQAGRDMTGAWLYKLSPLYWLKSSRERNLIDAEKDNWQRTEDSAERNAKQQKILDQANRAKYQKEQAQAAQEHSQEIEAQIEDVEKTITSGAFVGADPGPALDAAAEGKAAARANGKRAGALAAKLESGEKLTPEELGKLRGCLKMCKNLKALHDQLHASTGAPVPESTSGYHDFKLAKNTQTDFLGENVIEILGAELPTNGGPGTTEILGEEYPTNGGPGTTEIVGAMSPPAATTASRKRHLIALTAIAVGNPSGLAAYMKNNGIRLSASEMQQVQQAAVRAKAIMKHPQYSQVTLKGDHYSTLGLQSTNMGFSWGKLLTAPLALASIPAAAIAWGTTKIVNAPAQLLKWGAKQGGWYGGKGGGSQPGAPGAPGGQSYTSPQAQQAAIQAAMQRQAAAQARINAANAADQQSQQAYQAQAAAADAEAQAQQAEAQAQQDQMDAQQAQFMPGQAADSSDDSGRVTVLGADFFSGAFVGEVDDPKAKKIVEEAAKDSPTGKKIRAGATLYSKAKKGHAPSKLAIAKIAHKARQGDPQAQRDYNAVKAGKIAMHARGRAKWKIALKAKKEAANKKGIAARKRLEANAGKRLGEHTRRKKLAKIAKVERLAAQGHPKARALVAHTVAKAKHGDKKAKTTVAALKLAKHVRTAARTPEERKRLHEAHKVVYKARRGNKKAIRTIALVNAAAKAGQPNAVRAKRRLAVAARVEHAVATGKLHPLPNKAKAHAEAVKKVKRVHARMAVGIATREEALGAAKAAHGVGAHKTAGQLAYHASKLPSAKTPIKQAAAMAAAANNGSEKAKKDIDETIKSAQAGDPKGIAGAGALAAAQAVATVDKGKPMPKPIADATLMVERAQAGDEEAQRTIQRAGAAAEDPNHPQHAKGVESTVALAAASTVLAATAGNAAAQAHWKDAAREATGQKVESNEEGKAKGELSDLTAKIKDGTATHRDGVRARELALALGDATLAAQISALMPPSDSADTPMSSLPDLPEPDIRGPLDFLRESVRALVFATSDPFSNYREGIRSRGGQG